ncbi:MAG: hypothetical protein WBZ35_20325, partial [Pseudolabrys sp.]
MVGMFYGDSKTPSFPYLAHRYLTSRMSAIGNRNDCFAEFHCATLSCLIEASYLQRQRGEKSKALSVPQQKCLAYCAPRLLKMDLCI